MIYTQHFNQIAVPPKVKIGRSAAPPSSKWVQEVKLEEDQTNQQNAKSDETSGPGNATKQICD